MLYLATKPDPVFTTIVDAALTHAGSWAYDTHDWSRRARHVVDGFRVHENPMTALPNLQMTHARASVYRMSHFFWVLLYDVLSVFAEHHNRAFHRNPTTCIDRMPVVGPYRCGPLRMASIVATFWWDLDCFAEATLDAGLVRPPSSHRSRGGPDRYAPAVDGLVEIKNPRWANNPDAAELETPGLTVPHYPLFAASATADSW